MRLKVSGGYRVGCVIKIVYFITLTDTPVLIKPLPKQAWRYIIQIRTHKLLAQSAKKTPL
jgi:hypothetical protein